MRRRALWVVAAFAGIAMSAGTTGAARAATFDWGPARYVATDIGGLLSCASAHLCVVDSSYLSTRPRAAGGTFRPFGFGRFKAGVNNIECPSDGLCIGSRQASPNFLNDEVFASRRPSRGARSYRRVATLRGGAYAFTCPSANFCGVVGQRRSGFSRRPAQKGMWISRMMPDAGQLQRLACSAAELCLAWQDPEDGVATMTRPFARGSRWRQTNLRLTRPGETYGGAACVGPSSCLITTSAGALLVSSHVEDGKDSWERSPAYDSDLGDPTCFSLTLCFALGSRDTGDGKRYELVYSTSPLAAGAAWQATPLPPAAREQVSDLSCPSPTLCFVSSDRPTRGKLYRTYVRAVSIAVP